MHNKIITEISICQAENGFSLDELVKKVADSYKKKALSDVLKMNLRLTQQFFMYRIFDGRSNHQYSPDGYLTQNGSFYRRPPHLAPDIVKLIWENRQPSTLTLDKLRKGIPESWEEQRKLFLAQA